MRAILAAVLGATVVNTLLTWSVIFHHSPSGSVVGHDDIMRALVRDELAMHQEKVIKEVRGITYREFQHHQCVLLGVLVNEGYHPVYEKSCYQGHWASGEGVE